MLRTNCLESSFTGIDLGVLMDKLNVIQQCSLTAKMANSLLSWVRQSITSPEVILPLYSALVRHIWRAGSRSGLPSARETGTYWSESSVGL